MEPAIIRWGPFMCTALGALMIMVDLTRHVLLDLELAGGELAMYNDSGGLSTVGKVGVILTWSGLALFVSGILWFVEVPSHAQRWWAARQ